VTEVTLLYAFEEKKRREKERRSSSVVGSISSISVPQMRLHFESYHHFKRTCGESIKKEAAFKEKK
jgi:hypothetical protein